MIYGDDVLERKTHIHRMIRGEKYLNSLSISARIHEDRGYYDRITVSPDNPEYELDDWVIGLSPESALKLAMLLIETATIANQRERQRDRYYEKLN